MPKDRQDLRNEMLVQLIRVVPDDASFAVLTYEDRGGGRCYLAAGDACPLQEDAVQELGAWDAAQTRIPLVYREAVLGEFQCDRPVTGDLERELIGILANFIVALVNLTLNEENRRTTESYCASLMALEEGVILFQEANPDAITARFLSLATTMMKSAAGALFVLDEVGQLDSNLALVQTLGFPEELLEQIRAEDGGPWPHCFLGEPAQMFEPQADGTFARIASGTAPDVITNIAILPLTYHGVTAGIVVLCNSEHSNEYADTGQVNLDRMKSLGELGAALMHRISLESINLRSQTLDTQLAIAANIQSRLQPRVAPKNPQLDCAWSTVAAQNIGGDYLDLLEPDGSGVFAVIADASGHGVNSALLMSSFRATWRAEATSVSPGMLLEALNREMCYEVGTTGMFITAATLRISSDGRWFTMSSAGHNDVYVYRAASGEIECIDSDGPPLGFLDGVSFDEREHALAPGDVIVLYTDGIVEATRSGDSEMFGDDRLKDVICAHKDESAEDILDAILTEMATFTHSANQEDDCSLSVIVAK